MLSFLLAIMGDISIPVPFSSLSYHIYIMEHFAYAVLISLRLYIAEETFEALMRLFLCNMTYINAITILLVLPTLGDLTNSFKLSRCEGSEVQSQFPVSQISGFLKNNILIIIYSCGSFHVYLQSPSTGVHRRAQ
jgi:hypothetical protein